MTVDPGSRGWNEHIHYTARDDWIESKAGYAQVTGQSGAMLVANAYYDSKTPQWNRYDTGGVASHVSLTPTLLAMYTTPAGANPITAWTPQFSVDASGNGMFTGKLNVGSGAAAYSAGDLAVSRGGGSPGSGVVYFGTTSGKYLYYDGTNFNFQGGAVIGSNDIYAGSGGSQSVWATNYFFASASYYWTRTQTNWAYSAGMHILSGGAFAFSANTGIQINWDGTYIATTHSIRSGNHFYMNGTHHYWANNGGIYMNWDGTGFSFTHRLNVPYATYLQWGGDTNRSIYADNGLMQFMLYAGPFRFYNVSKGMYVDATCNTAYGSIGWDLQFSQALVAPIFMPQGNSNGWMTHSTRAGASTNELAIIAHLNVPGTVYCTNTSTSSLRYKKDIEPLVPAEALERVLAIEPFSYALREPMPAGTNRSTERHLGFSAESMHEVIPEVVHYADLGEGMVPNGIEYSALIPLLWSAVQALNQRISELEAKAA